MTDKKICTKCGTELPVNAPAGVCPRCLLQAGMLESLPEVASVGNDATILTDSAAPANRANEPPTERNGENSEIATLMGENVRYFGEYELLTEIARGGMGVVYRARQVRLNRIVALKMILAGQFAGKADVQRFHTEAEAAAQLDHPGIVPIYEVGEHDGHHFFTMGFVEGGSLASRLLQGPLAPRDAALLVQQIAEAVQYAHEHGVIHRDLKPANILLDRAGQPRVSDFGLAKNTHHDSGLTASGQVMGTPSYMPPEQASGNANQVREVADVYSVGAILYALLTGRPPFQTDNVMDTLMQVLEREPVPLRQLNAAIPRDLEVIALKCLEKDRQRRYLSAREIADELQRFLDGRPIVARPISAPLRAWRWCRRNPLTAALVTTGVALVAVLSIGGPLWAIRESQLKQFANDQAKIATDKTTVAQVATLEATKQKSIAIAQAQVAREQTARANSQARVSTALRLATESRIRRNDEQVLSLLLAVEAVAVTLDAGEGVAPAAERELRDAMTQVPRPLVGHKGIIVGALLSDDGRTLLTSSLDEKLCVWDLNDLTSFAPRFVLREADPSLDLRRPKAFPVISLSENGRAAAAIRDDGAIQVWNLAEPDPLTTVRSLTLRRGMCQGIVFSADGLKLAAWGDAGEGSIWNLAAADSTPILLDGSESAISRIDMSSDGTTLAATTTESIKIWNQDDNSGGIATRFTLPRPKGKLQLALSSDGSKLVVTSQDSAVQIWDISGSKLGEQPTSWKLPEKNFLHFGPVVQANTLVTQLTDKVRVWDLAATDPAASGRTAPVRPGEIPAGPRVVLSRDGHTLACSNIHGTVRVWDLTKELTVENARVFQVAKSPVRGLAISADGAVLVTTNSEAAAGAGQPKDKSSSPTHQQVVRVWPLQPRGLADSVYLLEGDPNDLFGPMVIEDGTLLIAERARLSTGKGGPPPRRPGDVYAWRFAPTGELLAAPNVAAMIVSSPSPAGESLPPTTLEQRLVRSRDGRIVATIGQDYRLRIWRKSEGEKLKESASIELDRGALSVPYRPALSADGTTLAAIINRDSVRVWTVSEGGQLAEKCVLQATRTSSPIHTLSLSETGDKLFVFGTTDAARTWNLHDAHPERTERVFPSPSTPLSAAVSLDFRTLAVGSVDGVRIWDLSSAGGPDSPRFLRTPEAVLSLAVHPRGSQVYTSERGRIRIWELRVDRILAAARELAGRELTPEERTQFAVGMSTFAEIDDASRKVP